MKHSGVLRCAQAIKSGRRYVWFIFKPLTAHETISPRGADMLKAPIPPLGKKEKKSGYCGPVLTLPFC